MNLDIHSQINENLKISAFKVVKKNGLYNKLAGEFELNYVSNTTLTVEKDDDDVCPAIKFDFVKFDKIGEQEPGSQIGKIRNTKYVCINTYTETMSTNNKIIYISDVIGIATEVGQVEDVTNGPLRRISLVDETGNLLPLLLWKTAATELNIDRGTPMAIKAALIKSTTYQGVATKTLGLTANSAFWPSPIIPEAKYIVTWMNGVLAQMEQNENN